MGSSRHGFGTAALLALAVAVACLSPVGGGAASAQSSSPVTNALGGPGHNAATDQALPGDLSAAWHRSLPGTVGTPLEKDGRVFVAAGGMLYALSASDGATLWAVDVGGGVIALDGDTVLTSERRDGLLVAYDASTGLARWSRLAVNPSGRRQPYGSLAAPGGGVFYDTGSPGGVSLVEARRVATGKRLWSTPAGTGYLGVADGVVLAQPQFVCGVLALDPDDGSQRWAHPASCSPEPRRPYNDVMYEPAAAGVVYGNVGLVLSTADGNQVGTWSAQFAPVRVGSRLLSVSDGVLTERDASSGRVAWTYDGDDTDVTGTPYVVADSVFVTAASGRVHRLALAGGHEQATLQLPTRVYDPPRGTGQSDSSMTVADGQLLVPSTHVLTAFRGGEYRGPRPSAAPPVPVSLPVHAPSGDVTNYLGNAAHDNVTGTSGLSHSSHRAWVKEIGEAVSAPLVSRRHVIVTVGPTGDRLMAFNPRTGHRQWALMVRHGFGSSPVVAAGHVYVLTGQAKLLQVDEDTGHVDGHVQLPLSYADFPITTDGTAVYVKADNKVFAVPVAKPRKAWVVQVPGAGTDGTVAVAGSRVVWNGPCTTGGLDRLTGKGLWVSSNGCDGGGGVTPVVHGRAVFGVDPTDLNRALDVRTGLLSPFSYRADREPVAVGSVLFTNTLGVLRAEDVRTQRILWTQPGPYTLPPLVVGDRLIEVTSDGTVVDMSARTGRIHWRDALSTRVGSDVANRAAPPAPAAAHGTLAVPVGSRLVVYRSNG